jgi:hypothetical protein
MVRTHWPGCCPGGHPRTHSRSRIKQRLSCFDSFTLRLREKFAQCHSRTVRTSLTVDGSLRKRLWRFRTRRIVLRRWQKPVSMQPRRSPTTMRLALYAVTDPETNSGNSANKQRSSVFRVSVKPIQTLETTTIENISWVLARKYHAGDRGGLSGIFYVQ